MRENKTEGEGGKIASWMERGRNILRYRKCWRGWEKEFDRESEVWSWNCLIKKKR